MLRTLCKLVFGLGLVAASVLASAQAAGPLNGHVTVRQRGGGAGPLGGGPLGGGEGGDAKVLQALALSAAQKDQVDNFKKSVFADFAKFRDEHAGDKQALQQETRRRLQAYLQGLQGILDAGQARRYDVWMRGRRFLAGANDAVALQSLQLDNDTMSKIRELKTNEARDAEAGLLKNLADEQAAAAAVQRAHDAYLAYLQTALTPQQWAAYQEALRNPPAKPKGGKKKQF